MNQLDNIFGERLKEYRYLNCKTQKELAQELGMPQSTLSAYERGRIKPTIDVVINIADKCNVSLDWLCGKDDIHKINAMGDVMSLFTDLFITNEIDIKTNINHNAPENQDEKKEHIEIKIPYNTKDKDNKNKEICMIIKRAYNLSQDLKNFIISQDTYEREKLYYIKSINNILLTKVNHKNIPIEEQKKMFIEILKKEL